MLLSLLLAEPRPDYPFLLLQSTTAQTIFPLLRTLCNRPSVHTILYAFLYAPLTLVAQSSQTVEIYNWTGQVPGYSDCRGLETKMLMAIEGAPKDMPLSIVVDSLQMLSDNLGSSVGAYELLNKALSIMKQHPGPSQLVVHSFKPDDTADLLLQTAFSSSLVHMIAHPTQLFRHLSNEYMIFPPPVTPDIRFWAFFIPFSERIHEIEQLTFGSTGEGSGCGSEMIIEILTRGPNIASRKRGTERTLEGYDATKDIPCAISDLQNLKLLFSEKQVAEATPDPMHNLSFNLSLNESQQQSRAQVPLPYAHEGRPVNVSNNTSAIFYNPDSADDIDDDDPDEDLDI